MSQNRSSERLIRDILKLYGIVPIDIDTVQSGYRNHSYRIKTADGEYKNLIISKAEAGVATRIDRADTVAHVLHNAGLPVRHRNDARVVKMQSRSGSLPRFASLYNYLPGGTISWEAYTMDHLKVLGIAMASAHQALAVDTELSKQLSEGASVYNDLLGLLARIERYFSDSAVCTAARTKLSVRICFDFSKLRRALDTARRLPVQHALHMDFVRGNVLFSETPTESGISFNEVNLSGIIDFEKTAYGSPLFDLARTLAFLYVDCKYKSSEKVRKYFLHSGYKKHGGGSIESLGLLDELVELFLIHDFYKFMLHNPYESLAQNEHYLRTRDILLKRNMLK